MEINVDPYEAITLYGQHSYENDFSYWQITKSWSGQVSTHFLNSSSHFEFLGARMITRRKSHTEDPQFWSGLYTSLSLGSFCPQQITNIHLSLWEKAAFIMLAILRATLQDLVGWVTRRPEFVHSWTRQTVLHITQNSVRYASLHIKAFK